MRPYRYLALTPLLCGCVGPEAPDAAVCQDIIHRLCLPPRCQAVDDAFRAGDACEEALLARSGCANPDFTFTAVTRARALDCRLPLVREGAARELAPGCLVVEEVVDTCPDLVQLLNGAGP